MFVASDRPCVDAPNGNLQPIAFSIAFGFVVGSAYLALEPWVSRLWPHAMITWARLLSGKWRDPVVCRDLLVAIACATASHAIQRMAQALALSLGNAPAQPAPSGGTLGFYLGNLTSTRLMTADMILAFVRSLDVLMFFFVLLVARAYLRNNGERRLYTSHSGAWSWRLLTWSRGTGLSSAIGSSN